MRIENGTVKKPVGKEFETQYGVKQMMIVVLDNGSEEKFYVKPGSEQSHLQRNDKVKVVFEDRNGKTVRRIVIEEGTVAPHDYSSQSFNKLQTANKPVEQKTYGKIVKPTQEIIDETINAYLYTYELVLSKFGERGHELQTEDARTIATSIMIKLDRINSDITGLQLTEPPVMEEEEEEQTIDF